MIEEEYTVLCDNCDGTGSVEEKTCELCKGTGKLIVRNNNTLRWLLAITVGGVLCLLLIFS